MLSLTKKLFEWCQVMSKEWKRSEKLAIILQATKGINAYIGPTPMESDLKKISNDMWKSKNRLLDQNIWSAEVWRIESLLRSRISEIAYRRSINISDRNIRALEISLISYRILGILAHHNIKASSILEHHISEVNRHRRSTVATSELGGDHHIEAPSISTIRESKLQNVRTF